MRFSLIPREMKFFDMFDEASAILSRAADRFLAMVTQFDRLVERSDEIKREEHACDEVVERIIKALDRTFITPLDREDIHTLATRLDDILDNMGGCERSAACWRAAPSAENARGPGDRRPGPG